MCAYISRRGTSTGAQDSRGLPQGVKVIRGFKFEFEDKEDREIQEIGALTTSTNSGDLEVYFSDQSQNDNFEWDVDCVILTDMPSVN